jgi:hypothetical protein
MHADLGEAGITLARGGAEASGWLRAVGNRTLLAIDIVLGEGQRRLLLQHQPQHASVLALSGHLEDGDNRHTIDDFASLDHAQHFRKREGADFDKLGFIRGQCQRLEIFSHKQMGGLVHDALAGVVSTVLSAFFDPLWFVSVFERLGEVTQGSRTR